MRDHQAGLAAGVLPASSSERTTGGGLGLVPVSRWLSEAPERRYLTMDDGVRIAYRSSTPPGRTPGRTGTIVLIHGNAARMEWWDAIAPLMPAERVIALDLSGHGESNWREEYEFETWAGEVLAVLDIENVRRNVTLIGHSMGGLVALWAGWQDPERVCSTILLDTPFRRFTLEEQARREAIARRPLRRFPTLGEAIEGFKVSPQLLRRQDEVWDHLARTSYRHDEEGWVLHFDPTLFGRLTRVEDFLRPFPEDTHLVRAEHGLVTDASLAEMLPWLPGADRVLEIPGLGHNLLLEDPLIIGELVTGLLGKTTLERKHQP